MADALIGGTGLVGGTLLRGRPFDAVYRSTTIGEIAGRRFDRIYCAGAPAEKWKANQDPDADWRNLERLITPLLAAETDLLVLVSTVDVFGSPRHVTEDDEPLGATAYGRHRLELERILAERFRTLVVRLPATIRHGPQEERGLRPAARQQPGEDRLPQRFQFYDLERLAVDLDAAERAGLSLVHFATEPVTVGRMAREAFGIDFTNELPAEPASYDFRTRHAAAFGRAGPYLAGTEEVLAGMREFARAERRVRRCA